MKSVCILICIALTTAFPSLGQIKNKDVKLKVVIIRHGEKPPDGDNLCPRGWNRALLLPAVLDTVTGIPDFTYIPKINTGKTTRSVRMLQTITPFAVMHNLVLNSAFRNDDVQSLAKDILKKSGTILVVWDHANIPALAGALGIEGKMKWKDEDYGSIWIIEFMKRSAPPVLRIEQENLTPGGTCR